MEDWIIIVDDDAINLKLAKFIFTQANIRARYFKFGLDVLEYLDGGKRPALLLLDIHMPEIDGFEVLRRLREKREYKDTPAIFLTADEDPLAERRGLEAGAAGFVRKPFEAEALLRRVREAMAPHRAEQKQ